MINDWKRVGVCITKVQDEFFGHLLQRLFAHAAPHRVQLVVFNSFLDFYHGSTQDHEAGAASVYQLVDPTVLDALIIVDPCFCDKQIPRSLAQRARACGIPVVVLYGEYPDCFTIRGDETDAFTQLVAHVLDVHQPRDLRYIAGGRGQLHTERRLDIFRRVMAERGRTVTDEMIAYCNDWSGPVLDTINDWAARNDLPDALICASDVMAVAACDALRAHGKRVPEDVLVTGFDGLPSLRLYTPSLTTCGPDLDDTAEKVYRMLEGAAAGTMAPCSDLSLYVFEQGSSCGCGCGDSAAHRAQADSCARLLDETYRHEEQLYGWADRLLANSEQGLNRSLLQQAILPDSVLLLNHDPDAAASPLSNSQETPFSKQLSVITPGGIPDAQLGARVPLRELLSRLDAAPDKLLVLSSLYVSANTCGCYAVRVHNIERSAHSLFRSSRLMNLVFSVIDSRMRQEAAMRQLLQAQAGDSLTGLMNLHGLNDYIDAHYDELSHSFISVSVYVIYRYQKLLEDYGLAVMERMITAVADRLRAACPADSLVARISESDFIIINFAETSDGISMIIDATVNAFFEGVEAYNDTRGDQPAIEVHCGCVVSRPAWENNLMSYIKAANGEMYLNQMKSRMSIEKTDIAPHEGAEMLRLLLDKNLFHYFFQPIVDAHTGEIYAYEALMRTLEPINMMPAQILDVAGRERRLYDIERATLFNVMDYVDSHREQFDGKRIFINTIPGHFLNDADREALTSRYSHLFSSCTIEITEMDDTDDAELMQIRRLESSSGVCQLAIDDYGTGFSNIVNLLRYQPQVIKIDRYLISNVHRDTNKQLFIRSTIEFARMNGILVLAEGVETREELSKVIELGVDLVQGYYLARPDGSVPDAIPEKVQHFIIEETLRFSRFGSDRKVYHAKDGEHLDLLRLAVDKYTSIQMEDGTLHLTGKSGHAIDMPISVHQNAHSRLILENVCISAGAPALSLGINSHVEVEVRAENRFEQEGIRVPQSAVLRLTGEGSLDVSSIQKKGTVLGGAPDESFGKIIVDMAGKLRVQAESETSICVGGGFKDDDEPIELLRGSMMFEARGIHSVGVGCLDGTAAVIIGPQAKIRMLAVGNEAVGIGTLSGTAKIESQASLDLSIDGERITGIGVLNSGGGQVTLDGPGGDLVMRGANSVGIGSIGGNVDVLCKAERLYLRMEGARACSLGNRTGEGSVRILGGVIRSSVLSSGPLHIMPGAVIEGGNILLAGDESPVYAVSPFGEVLMPLTLLDQDTFCEQIASPSGSYAYSADRSNEKQLCVYVPAWVMKEYLLR